MPDAESPAGNDTMNRVEMDCCFDCPESLQAIVADDVGCVVQFIEFVNEDDDLLLIPDVFAESLTENLPKTEWL